MMRVVHYINQLFGGIGGEDKAHVGCTSRPGPVGPGSVIQTAFQGRAEIVGTIICGDNYFNENVERASAEVVAMARAFQPDLFLAGPAFNAGRYGVACATAARAVQKELGIPAVTGMFEENPGLELCREDVYVIQTTGAVTGMKDAIPKMVALACRLLAHEKIGSPAAEGYYPRGSLVNELCEKNGAERAIDMLMLKVRGEPFGSEVPRPAYDRVPPAKAIADLRLAKIALVTDGGLVPKGNPDRIPIRTASVFGRYEIAGLDSLRPENYEVTHEGYDSILVRRDPNRLVPVDTVRQLEREGGVGKLHDRFYSTTGRRQHRRDGPEGGADDCRGAESGGRYRRHSDLDLRDQHALRRNANEGNRKDRHSHGPRVRHHAGGADGGLQPDRCGAEDRESAGELRFERGAGEGIAAEPGGTGAGGAGRSTSRSRPSLRRGRERAAQPKDPLCEPAKAGP